MPVAAVRRKSCRRQGVTRELIASVPSIGTDLVFTTTGSTPVSGWSKIKGRLDAAMDDVPTVVRRTIRTGSS